MVVIAMITARIRRMGEGNVLTRVCPSIHDSVCPQGGGSGPVGGEGWVRSSCQGGGVGQLGGGVGQLGGGCGSAWGEGWVSWGEGWVSLGGGVGQPGEGGQQGEGWVS